IQVSIFPVLLAIPIQIRNPEVQALKEARSPLFPTVHSPDQNNIPNPCHSGPESAPVSRKSIPGKPAKSPDFLCFEKTIITALINKIRHYIAFELNPQT
ncbi:MAG: hypothetical protein LUO90_04610, partial [Methanoregula sp.]|nr:hypothetical protein [Methanoregula sp.]